MDMESPFTLVTPLPQSEIDAFNKLIIKQRTYRLFLLSVTVIVFLIISMHIPVLGYGIPLLAFSIVYTYIKYTNKTAYPLDNNYYYELFTLCAQSPETSAFAQQIKMSGRYFTNYEYHLVRKHLDKNYIPMRTLLVGSS